MNFRGRVFVIKPSVIKPRKPASGGDGRSPGRRAHCAEWHRLVLGALAAGGVGALSWVVLFPPAGVVPAVDQISSQALTAHASAGHGGQGGSRSAYSAPPRTYASPPRTEAQPPRTYAPPSTGPNGS